MGLDMYLNAYRSWHAEEADHLFDGTGITLDQLKSRAKRDDEWDRGLYLPRWSWSESSERLTAELVSHAAGLLDMGTDESMHGSIEYSPDLDAVTVGITCGYWRKANSVHGWFVDHVQGGLDECLEVQVQAEQLAHLMSLATDALGAYEAGDLEAARSILPPRQGFFFGSDEIDEWWAADMAYTVSELDRVIRQAVMTRQPNVTLTYRASW